MSTRRWAIFVCAALLWAAFATPGGALAQDDTIATFQQTDSIDVVETWDLRYFPAPEGLQPMYDLMGDANESSSSYIFIMPNGRALMSLSSTAVAAPGSAQSLKDAWFSIAVALAMQATQIAEDSSCAIEESLYGFEGIRIQTTLELGGAKSLFVAAQGEAFYQGSELIELWTVRPQGDESPETLADLETLRVLKDSLNFNEAATENTAL